MLCKKCNHALPADSEFCQYCGSRTEPAAQNDTLNTDKILPREITKHVTPPQATESYQPQGNIKPKKQAKNKVRYCSRCGSAIDKETKVCTGCGKKYFKGIRLNKFFVTVTILTLVIAGLLGLNAHQFFVSTTLQDNTETMQKKIDSLNSEIDALNLKIVRLNGEIIEKDKAFTQLEASNQSLEENSNIFFSQLSTLGGKTVIVSDPSSQIYHHGTCIETIGAKHGLTATCYYLPLTLVLQLGYAACTQCQ